MSAKWIDVNETFFYVYCIKTLLQEVIETQEKTITDLLKSVKEQHEQLNYQKVKIKSLEDKVIIDNPLKYLFVGQVNKTNLLM